MSAVPSATCTPCMNQILHYNPWNILSVVADRTRATSVSGTVSPRVLLPKEALLASLSSKISRSLPVHTIRYQLFLQFVKLNWTQTACGGRSRDVQLYRHDQYSAGVYPEIIVVDAYNTIIVEEPDGHMTLHSPSKILEALACVNAPCMLFLRDLNRDHVLYKGTFNALHVAASERVGYLSFNAKDQVRIVNITARLLGEPKDIVREEYRTGIKRLDAYKLEDVEWEGVDQFRRDMGSFLKKSMSDTRGEIEPDENYSMGSPPPRRSKRISNWPQRLPSMFVDLPSRRF